MNPPSNYRAWLKDGPWTFLAYNEKSIGERWRDGTAKPFMVNYDMWQDGFWPTHEVAHLIETPEEHMFEPSWGIRQFLGVNVERFSADVAERELRVCVIQHVIRTYCGLYCNIPDPVDWGLSLVDKHDGLISIEKARRLATTPIGEFWDELQRKYRLIREAGYVPGN